MIKKGDIITIKPQWRDAGNARFVIAHSGATVRGMRFYHPTLLNVSDHYARFLAGKGEVTIATIVR